MARQRIYMRIHAHTYCELRTELLEDDQLVKDLLPQDAEA